MPQSLHVLLCNRKKVHDDLEYTKRNGRGVQSSKVAFEKMEDKYIDLTGGDDKNDKHVNPKKRALSTAPIPGAAENAKNHSEYKINIDTSLEIFKYQLQVSVC
jgi:hypothetical protein